MNNLLVFQTDFGLDDGAISAMEGVSFGVSQSLNIRHLTHNIPQYNIFDASYRLFQAIGYWPEGTVFVSVVDPGVGSARKSDAMEKYGSDKPDLRFEMLQHNVTELFRNSEFSVFKTNLENNGVIKAIKVDNHSFSRKETDKFSEFVKIYKAKGVAFVKYENNDFTGGIAKFLSDDEKNALRNEFSLSENDTLLFVADKKSIADVAFRELMRRWNMVSMSYLGVQPS